MNTAILTDSTCDLSPELLAKYKIEVIPLSVHFGEEEYQDGIDINPDSFFKKLEEEKKVPSTSRPSLGLFLKKYEKLLQKYDQIISIHVSAALSGSFESAKLAAEKLEAEIIVIDSATISLGLGMLVLLTAKLVKANYSPAEIKTKIENAKENLFLYFTVQDLSYMEKGGRIGRASAFLGSILKINPLISISTKTGRVKAVAKVRGRHRAKNKLIKLVREKIDNEKKLWLGFAHGDREDDLNKMKNELLAKIEKNSPPMLKVFNSRISATLGCHVGPTVYAVIILNGDFLL